DGDEPRIDLAGGGAGQVRLAAARRAVHQNPPADRLAVRFIKFGMLERLDDLEANLLLHRLHAADAGKIDARLFDFHLAAPWPAVIGIRAHAAELIDFLLVPRLATERVVIVRLIAMA